MVTTHEADLLYMRNLLEEITVGALERRVVTLEHRLRRLDG